MSELKAFNSERIYWAVEQVERVVGDIDRLHLDDNWFFLKSEVDKVIEDKDAKILALDAEVFKQKHHAKLFFDERNYAETQLRRQKYKRCLAMADKCESMCYWFAARFDHHELVDNVKWELFDRWRLRWAKLADKFKEAK